VWYSVDHKQVEVTRQAYPLIAMVGGFFLGRTSYALKIIQQLLFSAFVKKKQPQTHTKTIGHICGPLYFVYRNM
jgi:hypothetical protein